MTRDWPALVERVTAASPARCSPIHGETHWRRVAALGLEIGAGGPVDAELVLLFAITHDSMRLSDGLDPDHGPRAAVFVGELDLGLSDDRQARLEGALAAHSLGTTSRDPTIGACWDADRLDLYRLGRIPLDDLLSTARARSPAMHARARELLAAPPAWSAILPTVTLHALTPAPARSYLDASEPPRRSASRVLDG